MTYGTSSIVLHGLAALVFQALSIQVLVRGRVSRTGRFLAVAAFATALWAGSVAIEGGFNRLSSILETVRIAAWAMFTGHLLRGVMKEQRNLPRWILAVPIAALLLTTWALEMPELFPVDQSLMTQISWLTQTDRVMRILLAVSGFLLLENLYRNAAAESRWHINLLTIGIGAIFTYDIVLYADAALFHGVSPALFVARAPVDMLAAPLIALAVGRNRRWLHDIRVSRNVIFHSSTLLISGIFLLAIGVAGEVLRDIGVTWGPVLEITLIFGAVLFVAVVFTSGRARSELRIFLIQNFFSSRYDYRKVWLGFIDTLSNQSFAGEQLGIRVIRAVADTVDSPAGSLWLNDGAGTAFSPVASWNLPRDGTPADAEFASAFRDGTWIVEFEKPGDATIPEVLRQTQRPWLAVPLTHLGRLLGFILLTEPRAKIALNWENYQVLKIASRQVASYMAEEQAARALVEARQLQAYSQRFAFVVHDIKNVVSQLQLMLSNGEKHAEDPEFQRDMLETVRHSVASMNKMLAQLRANREAEMAESVVPEVAVAELLKAWQPKKRVEIHFHSDEAGGRVRIGRDKLDSALRHLLDNAVEVSASGAEVAIEVRSAGDKVLIDIRDTGQGMTADFITNHLFQPFRSTKSEGYGIGAYQTRELIRAARGDLLVLSEPGRGTIMRIVLPTESGSAVSSRETKVLGTVS
ncbi:MAG TPA: XrtA/PEP-CTERM system histidine kinase PrsK [Alphaproteobacteria bacterium]|nr:XrtA/PEP-CTERM system histidine kinase PrsK [Alphaproteobacteria bacterium]